MTFPTNPTPRRFFQLNRLAAAVLALAPVFATAGAHSYEFHHTAKGVRVTAAPGSNPADSGGQNPTQPPVTPAPTYTAALSSSSLTFGSIRTGTTKDLGVSLLNTGTGTLTLAVPQVTAGYSITTNCGSTLAAGKSCDSVVQFQPTSSQDYPATATFASNASNSPLVVVLTGKGEIATGTLTANTSEDFGVVNTGQWSERVFTFKNTSGVSAPKTYAQVNRSELSIEGNTCGTAAAPVEVQPGASCVITVKYAPVAESNLAGATLAVVSQATGSPFTVELKGSSTPVDTASADVTFLLHADGALSDSSSVHLPMSTAGTANAGSRRAKFGAGALQLDGSSAAVTTGASTGFGFGKGDFTIEAWFYQEDGQPANATIMDFRTSGYFNQVKPTIFAYGGGVQYYTNGGIPAGMSVAVAANTWHHVAFSRKAGTSRFFVDGVQIGSNFADANDYGSSADLILGQVGDNRTYAPGYFKGTIDEVRVTKGVGRYTGNFTLPGTAFPNP